SLASTMARGGDRAALAEAAQQGEVQIETDQLRTSPRSPVSHDLRPPLAAIAGAASSLQEDYAALDASMRHDLCQTIAEEAHRLNRLVNNLLEMTRIESGAIQVHKEWQPLEEGGGGALDRLEGEAGDRPLTTNLP